MTTIFPYILNHKTYSGVFGDVPKLCVQCLAEAGSNFVENLVQSVSENVIEECRRGIGICKKEIKEQCIHICDKEKINLSRDITCRIFVLDEAMLEMGRLFSKLQNAGESYDRELLSLRRIVLEKSKTTDYALPGKTPVVIKRDSLHKILNVLDKLAEIMDEANAMVNCFDMTTFDIPDFLVKYLTEAKRMGLPIYGQKEISLDEIARLQRARDKKQKSSCGIPLSCVFGVQKMCADMKRCAEGITAFNQWIHDANHYMCRLRVFLRKSHNNTMDIDSFHSIDALSSALVALRTEFSTLFGISCSIKDSGSRRHTYEPYRLFHTYRYCYFNEGIDWKMDGCEFTRSARHVEGIESVALNLYANAVKYLSRYKGEKIVRTTFNEFEDHVGISISSMGPEIMPDEMPRILKGGYRARSVQNKYPGLGRGLSRIIKICSDAGYGFYVSAGRPSNICTGYSEFVATIEIPNSCFV